MGSLLHWPHPAPLLPLRGMRSPLSLLFSTLRNQVSSPVPHKVSSPGPSSLPFFGCSFIAQCLFNVLSLKTAHSTQGEAAPEWCRVRQSPPLLSWWCCLWTGDAVPGAPQDRVSPCGCQGSADSHSTCHWPGSLGPFLQHCSSGHT